MRIPCRVWMGVAGLVVALSLSASAQTDTNEGFDEGDLMDQIHRVVEERDQNIEREIATIKKQLGKLERVAAQRQAAGEQSGSKAASAAAVRDNQWRFKYHQGRWWYWMPDERWVYWSNNRWVRIRQPSSAARTPIARAGDSQSSAGRSRPVK